MKYRERTCMLFYMLFLVTGVLLAQNIVAKKGSYGVDKENRIIVWHLRDLDSINTLDYKVSSLEFDAIYSLNNSSRPLSYSRTEVRHMEQTYSLYISKMPLVHIAFDTIAIKNKSKIPGSFTFFNDGEYIESVMRVRHRGNLSLTFAKKSFDLEFWTDTITKKTRDLKFLEMRDDDDWILDAMYNEPLRLRSYIATHLWSEIHKPYYQQKEPKAKSGFGAQYVEVFKNNSYYGIYQLMESVDRKQLQIKKHEGNVINGELYKANSYDGGPAFESAPEYSNLFPHWNGWKTEYPFINYESNWQNLSDFVGLVVSGTDEEFIKRISNLLHIPNAVDYFLFVNLMRASDNLGKNYYLGKYDVNEPYFFIPWDLDGVWGVIQDGKREWVNNDVLTNGLFRRLTKLDPDGFNDKVKARWKSLRAKEFSNDALFGKINSIYDEFSKNGVYEREQNIWQQSKLFKVPNNDHYKHLEWWLTERLAHLDKHFDAL